MKNLLLLLFFICAAVNAQEVVQQDVLKLGKAASSADKSVTFDTADGVSNPKLSVEKVSKKLKYDQSTFQLGGSSTTDTKDFIFNGDNKKIRYDGTANELQYDGDLLSVGDGTNTNKVLKFNKGASSPSVRYNSATAKLEFSNDNTTFKAIGSGSGSSGGINILANADFEDGVTTGWTNSGGTFTSQNYTTPTESNIKFARFVASGAGQYIESTLTAVPSFLGAGCQAQFEKYATVTDGAWKIVVLDSSANVLATQNFNQSGGASTFISTPLLSFPCPVSPATFKVRLESLAAATIDFDLAYGGGNKNVVDTAQAKYYGSVEFDTNCSWTTNSATFAQFAADASCTIVTTGSVLAPATNIPGFRLPVGAPAGKYFIQANYNHYNDSVSGTPRTWVQGFYDGVGVTAEDMGFNQTAATDIAYIANLNYGLQLTSSLTSEKLFDLRGKASTSNSNINNDATSKSRFDIFYYPSDSQTAVTSEQSGWFIDANIGGAAISSVITSSYIPLSDAGLDLVLNNGSAAAKIPCTGTNAPQGLTCNTGPVNENVGVVFSPPYAGFYMACASYSQRTINSAIFATQLVETAPNSETIIQEGKSRLATSNGTASSVHDTLQNCGTFYFSSTSERAIRLMYEGDTALGPAVLADRLSTGGQRDIHIIVFPLTQNTNRPVLTGEQVISPGATKPKICSWDFSSGGAISNALGCTPTMPSYSGGTGTFAFSGIWSVKPNCTCTTRDNNGSCSESSVSEPSTTNYEVITRNVANATTNTGGFVICHGQGN